MRSNNNTNPPVSGRRPGVCANWARERLTRHFLDVIILYKLKEDLTHGYELIKFVHDEFGVFLSPGTLYPALYDLEKSGLVRSEMAGKKRMYALADPLAAEAIFDDFRKACSQVLRWMA